MHYYIPKRKSRSRSRKRLRKPIKRRTRTRTPTRGPKGRFIGRRRSMGYKRRSRY